MGIPPAEPTPDLIRACREDLLAWFHRHRRALPWREDRSPYRVWISELMLQQTRVDQATPYFERFMARFPTVESLAKAPQQHVLKAWEGLGYYARARRAHDTARCIVRERSGQFPDTLEGLRALPGVGPYTAAAVGSIAFGLDAAVVDGNVQRVLARLFGFGGDVRNAAGRAQMARWADALLPRGQASDFNEAMMELGATVCTPKQPLCLLCPLRAVCRAAAQGRAEAYPAARPKRKVPHKVVGAGVIVNQRGEILIARRLEGSMLGGLWEFPGGSREEGETVEACIARELKEELGIGAVVGERLIVVRHAFSHFTMDLHAHWALVARGRPRAIQCSAVAWVRPARFEAYPFPKADLKVIEALRKTDPAAVYRTLKQDARSGP